MTKLHVLMAKQLGKLKMSSILKVTEKNWKSNSSLVITLYSRNAVACAFEAFLSDIEISCTPDDLTIVIPDCVLTNLNIKPDNLKFSNETENCIKNSNKVIIRKIVIWNTKHLQFRTGRILPLQFQRQKNAAWPRL